MAATEAKPWATNEVNSIANPRIAYTVNYSNDYVKHNSDPVLCAEEVIQLATPMIQKLPDDQREVTIAEIHGFPGIDSLSDLSNWTSPAEYQMGQIVIRIEEKMRILAQKNGLVCNTNADIPGTSLIVKITRERDLSSLWRDLNISGFSTSCQKSFLKVSLQKIPSDKIIPIPSRTLREKILAKIKGLF